MCVKPIYWEIQVWVSYILLISVINPQHMLLEIGLCGVVLILNQIEYH